MARPLAIAVCAFAAFAPLAGAAPAPGAEVSSHDSSVATEDAKALLSQANAILARKGSDRDVPVAAALLERAVAAGNTAAMRTLAALLGRGDGMPADPARAEMLLQQAIAAGDTKLGNEALGDFYRFGTPPRDPEKAVGAYQAAADAGDIGAVRKLAVLIGRGDGAAADPQRAETLLQQAIAGGDKKWSNEALGDLYLAQTSLKDASKAAAAYQAAADAGNTSAMRKLAALALAGNGIAADPGRAEALLQQAIAAGDNSAWNALGDLYRASTPLADAAKAADAYQHAADAHSLTGARNLMTMLANGDGVPADPQRAEAIPNSVIASGDAKNGYEMLGDFYRLYTPLKAAAKAVDAYQQAADAGNPSAARKLAAMLWRGDGVPMDMKRALAVLNADIAAGDTRSGNEILGDLYRLEIPRGDPAAAMAAYKAAADAGNLSATRKLAAMLAMRTPGVRSQPDQAEALLKQAADTDPKNGFAALGDFYIARTPLRNPAKAIDAYQRAAAAGNASAVLKLASAHLNRRLGAASSPAKGVDLLKSAIADHVPNAAVTLANAYIWGTGIPKAPGTAVQILKTAASGGDVSAARRLVNLYSMGTVKGIGRSLSRASTVLAAIEPQLTPDVKALEELVLKAAGATSAAARSAILTQYLAFEGEARATAAQRIAQVNPGTYVYIAQSLLAQRHLYDGARNGLLTTATARAMVRFCGQAGLGSVCTVRGPLSGAAIAAMAKAL
ncbi:MAG TPA: hypothetical protein VG894_04950 [Bauldia sp.]|nr:hypothetical protein [Bauldia sp.]